VKKEHLPDSGVPKDSAKRIRKARTIKVDSQPKNFCYNKSQNIIFK
jgi:hypothetical protein